MADAVKRSPLFYINAKAFSNFKRPQIKPFRSPNFKKYINTYFEKDIAKLASFCRPGRALNYKYQLVFFPSTLLKIFS